MASGSPLKSLLKHARETIDECVPSEHTIQASREAIDGKLNEILFAVSAAGHASPRPELSCEEKGDVWHIVVKLWNWCADVHNSSTVAPLWLAAIRQHTSDLLELVKDDELSIDERSTKLAIFHKTGAAYAKAGEHEAAEAAYSRAQEQGARLMKDVQDTNVTQAQLCDIMTGCMDLILDRLTNAWKLHQTVLASDLLTHATDLAKQAALPCQQRFHMCREVILACIERGQQCLNAKDKDAQSLLDRAYHLITEDLELDEDDGDFEKFGREATSLQAQVLRLLSQAYLLNGQAAHAHACIQNLRQLQDPVADSPGFYLTAIEALTKLEQPEQADAELLALVAHKDASAALCLAGLSAVVQAPRCSALKPGADIVLERFAEDHTVPLRMLEVLLGSAEEKEISKERGALVLDIASNQKVVQLFRKAYGSTKEQRKSMYVLLWNHATQHFTSKDYRACVDFYAIALEYAEADAKAAVARQLALAHLALEELDRSLESLDIAAECDPSSVYTTFTRIKVLLMQGATSKALNLLQPLMACEGASLDILRVVCLEAQLANTKAVAKEALTMLWEDAIALQGPSERPGENASIARILIKTITDMEDGYDLQRAHCKPCTAAAARHTSRAATDGGEGNSQDSIHQELAGLFSQAEDRLEAVGRDSFFGPESPAWFAAAAYNAALAAMHAKDTIAAAVLFKASGRFHEALPTPTPQYMATHMNAYMLATSCTLEEHSRRPDNISCLSLAQALLEKASAAAEAAAQHPTPPKELLTARKALHTLELDLTKRQGKHGQMLQLIQQARTEGLFSADELLQLSHLCRAAPCAHLPAAKAALNAALQGMRSQNGLPPMDAIAETVRHLYELSSEEEALALLADTATYVRSTDMPSYPRRHAKFLRHTKALSFMAAALSLTDLCEEFKDRKEELQKAYEKIKEASE